MDMMQVFARIIRAARARFGATSGGDALADDARAADVPLATSPELPGGTSHEAAPDPQPDDTLAGAHIFISYARADAAFVARLRDALARHGRGIWLDTDNLRPSQVYWDKIDRAIDRAVAFIAVLSPDSAASAQCEREINRALSNQQRIVPIVCRDIEWNSGAVGQGARKIRETLHLASFVPPADFGSAVELLVKTLDNEWEDAEITAELRALAIAWESSGKSDGSTLNADQLAAFQKWITEGVGRRIPIGEREREILRASQEKAERDRKALEDALDLARKNERSALTRESLRLADESRRQTALGRPDMGAKLALTALPRSVVAPERPLTRAAEMALFAALAKRPTKFTINPEYQRELKQVGVSAQGRFAFATYSHFSGHTQLWDLVAGEHIASFDQHDYHRHYAAFSNDERLLAIAFYSTMGTLVYFDGEPVGLRVAIFETRTGDLRHSMRFPGSDRAHLLFSPDDTTLLVATDTMFALLDAATWQPTSGNEIASPIVKARFSDDGQKLALADEAGEVVVVRAAERSMSHLVQSDSVPLSLHFTGDDDERLLVAITHGVYEFDSRGAGSWRKHDMQQTSPVLAAGISGQPQQIFALTRDGRLHRWHDGREEDDSIATASELTSASVSADGHWVVTDEGEGRIAIVNVGNGSRLHLPRSENRTLLHACFSSHGDVMILGTGDHRALVCDLSDGLGFPTVLSDPQRTASAMTVDGGGTRVAVGYENGDLELRTTANDVLWSAENAHDTPVEHLGFDAEERRLVSSSRDGTVAVWDLDTNHSSRRLRGHDKAVTFAGFSRDGSRLLTASQDSSCVLWDPASGEICHRLTVPRTYLDPIYNASINHHGVFTSDGATVVTVSSGDGAEIHQPALVWNALDGTLMHALAHRAAIWRVLLTPDDRHAITASYDGTVCVWDLRTGGKVRTLTGHADGVHEICLFHDGKLLATGSRDGTTRVWLLASGEMVHVLRGDDHAIVSLSAAAQGRLLAAGASNGTARVWDGLDGHLLYEVNAPGGALWDLALGEDPPMLYLRPQKGPAEARRLPPLGQSLLDLAWSRYAPDGQPFTAGQRERHGLAERQF